MEGLQPSPSSPSGLLLSGLLLCCLFLCLSLRCLFGGFPPPFSPARKPLLRAGPLSTCRAWRAGKEGRAGADGQVCFEWPLLNLSGCYCSNYRGSCHPQFTACWKTWKQPAIQTVVLHNDYSGLARKFPTDSGRKPMKSARGVREERPGWPTFTYEGRWSPPSGGSPPAPRTPEP